MGNVHMEATQINYRGGSKKMSVEEAIKAAGTEITPEEKTWIDSIPALTTSNAGKTDQDVIAPEFDAEAGVYDVGDKVMYDGKLYEFTSAHETPGDWDSTEVSETTVADELNSLESGLMGEVVSITTSATLYKQGKFRMLVICGSASTHDGLIAIVPAGDRPATQHNYPSMFIEDNTTKAGYLQINANGNVYIHNYDNVLKDNCPVYGSYCYYII